MDMNRNLFSAIQLEKTAMFVILTLIVFVAAFAIISHLILMVTEKRREIGVLRALGAGARSIMLIFMAEGVLIGFVGTLVGAALGITIGWTSSRSCPCGCTLWTWPSSASPRWSSPSWRRSTRRGRRPASTRWRCSAMSEPPAPEPGPALIVVDHVEKEYRTGSESLRVLKGVNLTVRAGELVAIVGASGVGKSTLLHVVGALDRPTAGRVLFRGEDLFARSDAELTRFRRQEVGFVFQLYNLLPEFTALENAMLPALIQRRSPAEARAGALDGLREVGLTERVHHRPGELSGGEQQRVALARALVGRPAVIVADEPTGNLDPKTSEGVFELFSRLQAERGVTFVIATHNLELARRADRVVRLVDGRAVTE
jgi:lipoprotein-releasing system ATP-binding protein